MNNLAAALVIGVFMAASVSQAAPTYLDALRRVEAISNDQTRSRFTSAVGPWTDSVSFGVPGPQIVVAQRSSDLSSTGVSFYGVCSGDSFTTGSSTLFARVRLAEQTLITFGGNYNRFGIVGNSEISASIVGGDYTFSFAAPQEEIPSGSFGQTDVLLQPGDYDINLLVRSIDFEAVNLTFNLTFTTVPSPGAAGLGAGALGIAGLRRSRRGV